MSFIAHGVRLVGCCLVEGSWALRAKTRQIAGRHTLDATATTASAPEYMSIQIHKYTDTQIHKYSNIEDRQLTGTQWMLLLQLATSASAPKAHQSSVTQCSAHFTIMHSSAL